MPALQAVPRPTSAQHQTLIPVILPDVLHGRQSCYVSLAPISWAAGALSTLPLVLVAGTPQQPGGFLTADAGHQIPLPSHISFCPISARSGNDRDPQQFQAGLSQSIVMGGAEKSTSFALRT